MTFPSQLLEISPAECSLLRPGFDQLAAGLAGAKLGRFPNRHPWDRTNPQLADAYPDQEFSQSHADMVIAVRKQLRAITRTRKVSMNVHAIAAAAFALRLYTTSSGDVDTRDARLALARKLETFRKRAKRAAESKVGKTETADELKSWRRFIDWCRYHILYAPATQKALIGKIFKPYTYTRKLWTERRSGLADMIHRSLEERHYAALTQAQMERVVRLLKDEIRRGRHPYTLLELLNANDAAGREFLFRAVGKKVELTALAGADVPEWVKALARAERFRDKSYRANPTTPIATSTKPVAPAPQAGAAPSTPVPDVSSPPSFVECPDGLLGSWRSLSNQELAEAVAVWFEIHAARNHWEDVGSFALTETLMHPPPRVTVPQAKSLGELMHNARPKELDSNDLSYPARVAYQGEWMLTWLYRHRDRYVEIASILRAGYMVAVRRNPIATAA